jgi:hypothetical protein
VNFIACVGFMYCGRSCPKRWNIPFRENMFLSSGHSQSSGEREIDSHNQYDKLVGKEDREGHLTCLCM